MNNTPTNEELVELVSDAMFATANSETREVDHFDIGRKFNLGNVQQELAYRIAERLAPIIHTTVAKKTAKALKQLKADMQMHTVPEGKHLITRSYLNNSIDFMVEKLEGA